MARGSQLSAEMILYGEFDDAEARSTRERAKRQQELDLKYRDQLKQVKKIRRQRQQLLSQKRFEEIQDYDGDGIAPWAEKYGLSEADLEQIFDFTVNNRYSSPSEKAYKTCLEILYPPGTRVVTTARIIETGVVVPTGSEGTVESMDDAPKFYIKWDQGYNMPLLLSDKFTLDAPESVLPELPRRERA